MVFPERKKPTPPVYTRRISKNVPPSRRGRAHVGTRKNVALVVVVQRLFIGVSYSTISFGYGS